MKKLLLVSALFVLLSCSKDDLSWKQELDDLKQELAAQKQLLATQQQEITNQRRILEAIQNSPLITGITTDVNESYTINFSNGQSVILRNGSTPVLTIGENGNWIIDGKDTGMPSKGTDGKDSPYILKIEVDDNSLIFYFSDNTTMAIDVEDLFENINKKHYNTYSVLGDSYSTYNGYMTPVTNISYFPNSTENSDVDNVYETWWYLFSEKYGAVLQVNNSFSGSPICYDGYGLGNSDSREFSFLERCNNLGRSELIIIEGGTNDSWAGAGMGEYKYGNWTENDCTTFRPALAKMLDYIKKQYVDSYIVFMLNDGLSAEIVESVNTICDHYKVPVLVLSDISKHSSHPNEKGMLQIADALVEFLNK